eukprot:Hpha_TRINITY_DN29862_c0_g1::TRINITY_DN29862_c0_g1_i1::g.2899::m.2899
MGEARAKLERLAQAREAAVCAAGEEKAKAEAAVLALDREEEELRTELLVLLQAAAELQAGRSPLPLLSRVRKRCGPVAERTSPVARTVSPPVVLGPGGAASALLRDDYVVVDNFLPPADAEGLRKTLETLHGAGRFRQGLTLGGKEDTSGRGDLIMPIAADDCGDDIDPILRFRDAADLYVSEVAGELFRAGAK